MTRTDVKVALAATAAGAVTMLVVAGVRLSVPAVAVIAVVAYAAGVWDGRRNRRGGRAAAWAAGVTTDITASLRGKRGGETS